MVLVIVTVRHQEVDIKRFRNETKAYEFIEKVETDPDVRCEIVYGD